MKNKCLAIIPARGGSKRIPNKNIKPFLGIPIIKYSIKAAIKSCLFDEIMVSTDNAKIAEIAQKSGAEIPFMRSKKNADDYTGIADVLIEVIEEYKKIGKNFLYVCCILPTAVFVTPNRIIEGYNKLVNDNYDSIFPVVKFSYPIQRALFLDNDIIKMKWPENYSKRSQDLEETYHDCGQFYWIKTKVFLNEKKMFLNKGSVVVLSELEVQDIDTLEDWKIAEIKYKILNNDCV